MTKFIDVGSVIFKKEAPGNRCARPGTLIISEDAVPPMVRMISYDLDEVDEREITDVEDLAKAMEPENITWIDVQGFGDEEVVRRIGEIFSIHPLALEDIVNMPQRPKTESYDGQLLVITRMVRHTEEKAVDMEQVSHLDGQELRADLSRALWRRA